MMAPPTDVYPVSEVTRYLRELLEGNRHLTDIWIEGEVSNLSLAPPATSTSRSRISAPVCAAPSSATATSASESG